MTTSNTQFQPRRLREVEVFAYIRFADESITFQQTLNSLLPAVTKGVLVYHRLPDEAPEMTRRGQARSIAIAREFCAAHRGFELICYPHVVYAQRHEKYFRDRVCRQRKAQGLPPLEGFDQELPFEHTLQAFYEFTRDQIIQRAQTSFPYALKVDGDHIYDATVIQQQIDFLATAPELIKFLGMRKFNVFYSRTRDQLFFRNVVVADDHFFMLAHTMEFTSYCDDKYDINGNQVLNTYEAFERLQRLKFDIPLSYSQPWLKRKLLQLRGKKPAKYKLTQEYLFTLLPEQGAKFKALYGVRTQPPAIDLYSFTPEQYRAAYTPQAAQVFATPQANGLPAAIQQQYPAACTLTQVPSPDARKVYGYLAQHYQQATPQPSVVADVQAANQRGTLLLSEITVPWFNSAHFLLQKHAVIGHPESGDYRDDELSELQLVRFSLFRQSALCAELAIRYRYFDPEMLLFNEGKLLELARKFDYSCYFPADH